MTLTTQAKKKKSLKKQHQEGEEEEEQPLKNRPPLPIVGGAAVPEEAAILHQGIRPPVKMSKEPGRQQQAARRQEPGESYIIHIRARARALWVITGSVPCSLFRNDLRVQFLPRVIY